MNVPARLPLFWHLDTGSVPFGWSAREAAEGSRVVWLFDKCVAAQLLRKPAQHPCSFLRPPGARRVPDFPPSAPLLRRSGASPYVPLIFGRSPFQHC